MLDLRGAEQPRIEEAKQIREPEGEAHFFQCAARRHTHGDASSLEMLEHGSDAADRFQILAERGERPSIEVGDERFREPSTEASFDSTDDVGEAPTAKMFVHLGLGKRQFDLVQRLTQRLGREGLRIHEDAVAVEDHQCRRHFLCS